MSDDEEEEEDLRSRSDARRERKFAEAELAALAEALVNLSSKQRASLELPELLDDAIDEMARMPNPRARARQLRVVRRELRDLDHQAVADRIDVLLHPERALPPEQGPPEQGPADAWLERMIEGDGVESFLSDHPEADRQRLRTLTRNVRKAEGKRRKKARRALRDAIAKHLDR